MGSFDKAFPAKILAVSTAQAEGLVSDSILIGFEVDGNPESKTFESLFLIPDHIRKWRSVCLAVILDMRVPEDDQRLYDFEAYRNTLLQKKVFIAYDGEDVYAIGKKADYMFFPDMYGLWGLDR